MYKIISPNACKYCGFDKEMHCQRWSPVVSWHTWMAPTQEQIKERMIERRNAKSI